MAWSVEFTGEFADWWDRLPRNVQEAVASMVGVLEQKGPSLGRPFADTLKGSRIPNLKELRIQQGGGSYRVLFAFDPRQTAILLLGGRKGPKHWYRAAVAKAERIYNRYLGELKEEGLL